MKNLTIFFVLLCVFFLNGCYKIYFYKDYPLKVVDAESNQLIEGAFVTLSYSPGLGELEFFSISASPKRMRIKTGAEGLAKLKIATNPGIYHPRYIIEAEGYLPVSLRRPWNKDEDIVALYRKPEPGIEIKVSDD